MNNAPQFRDGNERDSDWLFRLFRATMQNYIDQAWGWDELLQREGFLVSLPAREFRILEIAGAATGSYHLSDKPDRLELDMILVEPSLQRRGYGRLMMEEIKNLASRVDKPVVLSVLRSNPAVKFHLAEGFEIIAEDEHSLKMRWAS